MTTREEVLKAQQELASRVLARRRLLHFIKRRDSTYLDGWVHADICRRLERFSDQVAAGTSPRLMLLMPPRHGKSRIASQEFPAWHLGRNPTHEFIAASYNVSLPMGFSRKVQACLEDPRYPFEGVKLDQGNKSAETWGIEGYPGGFIAAGVGGGITGKGAHILLIDDPIKNAEEADSAVVREALWDWYMSTAYTRLAPGGGVLVIQTCWHDDDLAGRLQQAMVADLDDPDVDRFEIIKYPAIADADEWIENDTDDVVRIESPEKVEREVIELRLDEHRAAATERAKDEIDVTKYKLQRAKGEPLHPARYDLTRLMRIKKALTTRFWSALYQQNPAPEDGAFFLREQFKRAQLPPKNACNVYITVDFAITEKQRNDSTVIRVGLQDEFDMLHMADMVRIKSNDPQKIIDALIMLIMRWRVPHMRMGFENGQIFLSMKVALDQRLRKERLFIPYEVLQPVTDKQARATPLQGRMQQGRVSFAEGVEWFPVTQNEYLRFPTGIHDDIVDADAWLARLVEKYAAPRLPKPKAEKSWKDQIPKIVRAQGRSRGSPMSA